MKNLIKLICVFIVFTQISCKKEDTPQPIVKRKVAISLDVYYKKSPYLVEGFLVNKNLYTAIISNNDLSLNNYSTQQVNNKTYINEFDVNTVLNISYRIDIYKNQPDSVITSIYVDNNLVLKSNQLTINYIIK